MCRIMSITNLSKVKNLNAVMLTVRDLVAEHNGDGYGHALSYKNSIYAEKFLDPKDFTGLDTKGPHAKMTLDIFEDTTSCVYGEVGDRPLALVAHGRTSTNHKGLVEYSHPFVKDGQAFIHNGVVEVTKNSYDLETKNDSEFLANVYWDKGIKGVSGVSGYYAFMNLNIGGRIDIVKDTASLYGAFCEELDSYIFATLESMIVRFAEKHKYTLSKIMAVNSFSHFTVKLGLVSGMGIFTKTNTKVKKLSALERKAFKDYGKDYTSKMIEDSFLDHDASVPSAFKDSRYYGSWEDDILTTNKEASRRKYFDNKKD